jgi:hypothetical protein
VAWKFYLQAKRVVGNTTHLKCTCLNANPRQVNLLRNKISFGNENQKESNDNFTHKTSA